MPRQRVYETDAERQKAYREREKQKEKEEETAPGKPGYVKWRKELQRAIEILEHINNESYDYIQERSERWTESDRGQDLEADRDTLEEVIDGLRELSIWRRKA